jgi:hypothetical protein
LEVVPISQTERRINKLYANFCVIRKEVSLSIIKATNRALPLALELGGLLIEHKERIGHGNWETWVARQDFSLATTKRWMALNRRREEVARSGVESLDEAYQILGLKSTAPKRSPVSDLTVPEASDTDAPVTKEEGQPNPEVLWFPERRDPPAPLPVPEKPAEVQAAHEPDHLNTPVQPGSTELVSGNGDPSVQVFEYKVDALVTIRVTRRETAKNKEEAIQRAKEAHGDGLERHYGKSLKEYLESYKDCEEIELCSMTWSVTE